ncbi:PREDICTED: uncharacterized protein LOC104803640 [Tarenaya hassleriana]|uniref:uncharacterized protein LOC104803640 n=1 Tax=Tarenaya hassleriana TaxID=28532 RepID=UPI00053C0F6B|nr:PREDICTED: uncharacterized protein LOC104803640 [Tarenaya hassleriana]
MVATIDYWVTAAIMDDQMVAALLLRLKQAKTTAEKNPETLLPPLGWGIRQKRSRPSRFVCVAGVPVKEADSVRGSPVTPLSWSGGSGSSGGAAATADGIEEISRQASCSTSAGSGSKAFPANETTSSFSKRSKKKTFSELKDEENFLLKERLNLEKEIATMRTSIEEQSEKNQNLKRIKVDLNSDRARSGIRDDLIRETKTISPRKRKNSPVKEEPVSDSWRAVRSCSSDGGVFVLPDLNMTPSEDDVRMETLYGTIQLQHCQNT